MKKNLVYMLAVTQDYVFAAGNIVLSLIRERPQKDFDIAIFYDEMPETDKKIFEDTGICRLIQYKCPSEFEKIIRRDCPKFNDEAFAKHFSFLKFAKFEIFNLLQDYHHAVWLDADISIQFDPSDIVNYEPFAITIDRGWTVQNNFIKAIPDYDMKRQGVCSAVFMVTDKMRNYSKMRNWCYKKAAEVCPFFKNIDQGIFNLLLQEFKIDYQLLPLDDYQCYTDRTEGAIAKIVHFGTPSKVWNNTEIIASFPEWYRMHMKWMTLGGSDFAHPEDFSVVNVYQKLQSRNKEIKKWKDRANELEKAIKVLQSLSKDKQEKSFKIKILGITLFKRKVKDNILRYFFLGIPFLKVKILEK